MPAGFGFHSSYNQTQCSNQMESVKHGQQKADDDGMTTKTILQLCMGSACHQYGVYEVLPALQRLLAEHGLNDTIELRGAFCLGPCIKGIVVKAGEREFLNLNPDNVETVFNTEILPYLRQ